MSIDTLQFEQLDVSPLEPATIEFVVATDDYDDPLLDEQIAARSAEALIQFEVQYGSKMAEFVGNWCIENNKKAYDVIGKLSTPLAYLALGATVTYKEESIDGHQVFSDAYGLRDDASDLLDEPL